MSDKKLNEEEIRNILNRERTFIHAPKWPNATEYKDIAVAFDKGEKYVILSGKRFKLTYDKKYQQLHLAPVEGMLPRGWFDYSKLSELLKVGVH